MLWNVAVPVSLNFNYALWSPAVLHRLDERDFYSCSPITFETSCSRVSGLGNHLRDFELMPPERIVNFLFGISAFKSYLMGPLDDLEHAEKI